MGSVSITNRSLIAKVNPMPKPFSRRSQPRFIWWILIAYIVLQPIAPAVGGAQQLRGADSVRLDEKEGRFISRASGLAVARGGSIFVADNGNKAVLAYSPGGRFVRQFGKRGSGPGELESALQIALDGDTLLLVNNAARLRIEAFGVRDGKYKWGVALPRRPFSITSQGGVLRGASIEMGKNASIVEVRTPTGKTSVFGPLPEMIQRFPILGGPFGTVVHDDRLDRIAAMFEVSDYVYVWRRNSERSDSILVKKVRRRGTRQDLLQAAGRDTSKGIDALYKSSMPVAIGWLTDSSIAVVHSDVEYRGQLFEGQFFLSIVNTRTRLSCADLQLSVPRDPFPRFAFHGETLYALVQHVPEDGDALAYVVRFPMPSTCAARQR